MNKLTILGASLLISAVALPAVADMNHDGKASMPMNGGNMKMMQGSGAMGGMMNPEMMKQKQAMMQKHMATMEQRLANIEALMKELVELQKKK